MLTPQHLNPIQMHVLVDEADRLVLAAAQGDGLLTVGTAVFVRNSASAWTLELIHVEPNARRKGVGTAMVNYAEARIGDVQFDHKLTPDSVALAQALGKALPPNADVRSYAHWWGEEESADCEDPGPERRRPSL
jgi:GNAT superfamily N-acetyltransferase